MLETKRPDPDQIAVLVMAMLGISVVIYATPFGIGSSPDSVVYLVGARNLANGAGFSLPSIDGGMTPITHHAPFYAFILSIGEWLGIAALEWARILNSLLFAGNILLIYQIVRDAGAESPLEFKTGSQPYPFNLFARRLWKLLAAGLMLSAYFLVEIHSMAWTEALFIFLFLTGVLALGVYLHQPTSRHLWMASLATALALLTRYAGLAIVAAFGLAILLFARQEIRKRLQHALLFGLVSLAPLAFWLLRNSQVAGTAANRELVFHPIERGQAAQAITTISSWLLVPLDAPLLVKAVVIALFSLTILYLLYLKFRSKLAEEAHPVSTGFKLSGIILVMLIFVPVYLAFLALSLSFFDANTPLDGRILSPVYISALVIVAYLFLQIRLSSRLQRLALSGSWILALIIILVNSRQSIANIQASHLNGIGFDSPRWRESELIASLADFPPNLAVISNSPEPILLYTDRPAISLPRKVQIANRQVNPDYAAELESVTNRLITGGAILVYFNQIERPNLPDLDELRPALASAAIAGIKVLRVVEDGVIIGPGDMQ